MVVSKQDSCSDRALLRPLGQTSDTGAPGQANCGIHGHPVYTYLSILGIRSPRQNGPVLVNSKFTFEQCIGFFNLRTMFNLVQRLTTQRLTYFTARPNTSDATYGGQYDGQGSGHDFNTVRDHFVLK